MTQLTVRPIGPADEAQWRALWTGYLAFYDTVLPEAMFRVQFDRLVADTPRGIRGLVAETGGRLVGLVHYLFHAHGWRVEDVVYLQDLYVAPETRGAGAGRALVSAVYDAADTAGCPQVYWLTQTHNTTARRLYDRIGVATPFMKYSRA